MSEQIREKIVSLQFQLDALAVSIENDKKEAADFAAKYQLSPGEEEVEILEAIENRYLSKLEEQSSLKQDQKSCLEDLEKLYLNGCKDWEHEVIEGPVYHGWGSTYHTETWFLINKELPRKEILLLSRLFGLEDIAIKAQPDGRHRVVASYYAYRDTCWSERSGEWIANRMRALLFPKKSSEKIAENLKKFSVLSAK